MSETEQGFFYIAIRTRDMPNPPVASIADKCDSCGNDIWIDLVMKKVRDEARGAVCIPCVLEQTGSSLEELFSDNVEFIMKKFMEQYKK